MSGRTGRSGSNRPVTCLEAREMGYDFVNTCSKCDFYLQNKALNMKARTLPRSQLSKLWQCTSTHNSGELYHSNCRGTPYQPILPKKSTNYIVSDRSPDSRLKSKRTRQCIRSPEEIPPCPVAESPLETTTSDNPAMQLQLLELQRNTAMLERDLAVSEKERALAANNALIQERDLANTERDIAIIERDKARSAFDELKERYDGLANLRNTNSQKIIQLEKQIENLEREKNNLARENINLLQRQDNSDALIKVYSENLSQLNSRVNKLEAQRSNNNSITVGTSGDPLRYITSFASKLLSNVDKRERLNGMFDILYHGRKRFRNHVNRKLKDELRPVLRMSICREIRKHYAAWRFLEVMDSSSQSLNQECYKAIYSVQRHFPKWAKVLPEVKQIHRAQRQLNQHLNNIIPISLEPDRETGRFIYREYLEYLLAKFGLLQLVNDPNTTEPIQVAVTFDGGKISRFLGHVTGGYKLVDKRCIDPKSGLLLFGDNRSEKVQSHIHCFPIKVAFAKDTKDLYRLEYADFFLFLKEYEREKGFRIKFIFPQDMSSIWKTTGRGGTAKVKTFPCYCCAVTTTTLITPQPKEKCFRGHRCRQPKCYHHPMVTAATFEAWKTQKVLLENDYPHLSNPSPDMYKSQVFLSTIDELRDDNNPYDISFQPSTLQEGRHFDMLLNAELGYCRMPANGTIGEKRQRLRQALEAEAVYQLMTKLVLATDEASAFCEILDAIPCIMHGGNRVGEKVFMMLLLEAWSRCCNNTDRTLLLETVENFVNTGVFGSLDSRAQWKIPVNKENEIEAISFTAWRVKKILARLSDLVPQLQLEGSRLQQWQVMLSKYLEVIKLAFQHEDFGNEEVEIFQDLVDEWFYLYVDLLGLPGITNYIHLLGAGHLYHYLKTWGSLYRYQQQGWEMKNGIIASFINRRTRRGGAGGRYGPAHTSRIIPVMEWFQRTTAWITGEAAIYFENLS